jgi:AcrR family transcriptional regulator
MPRWEPDAPERLERAALELFAVRGFEQTTVPEIAARAGMTTRSFFRHFRDKREVLFRGDDEVPEKIAGLLASAPPSLSVMDALTWGVETIAKNFFEGHRDELRARRAIVETDLGLKERELRKQADMAGAIADALRGEGIDPLTATVAGKVAITISSTAITRWLDATDQRPLVAHITDVRQSVTDLTADTTSWQAA